MPDIDLEVAYKAAVEQGYTFKEIGKNIAISATAANKMVIKNSYEGRF